MSRRLPLAHALPLLVLLLVGCASHPPQPLQRTHSVHQLGGRYAIAGNAYTRLQRAFAQLTQVAGLSAELEIVPDMSPNAHFRMQGGRGVVAIHLGMIELIGDAESEYAFVFGHEFAHYRLKHIAQRQENREENSFWSDIFASILGVVGIPWGSVAVDAGAGLQQLSFSREQEVEADREGLSLMLKAGYRATGALSFQEKMAQFGDDGPEFLSTHPGAAARLELLRHRMAGNGDVQTQ